MTIQKALEITRKVLIENGLTSWIATTNNRKSAFGVCHYTKRQIQLSGILLPHCTEESIMDTIYHEVAHAIVGHRHGHNRVWKEKCVELGGNGLRCGDNSNYVNGKADIETKYTLVCPVCCSEIPRSRKPKRRVSCGNHNMKRFTEKYELKIIQNY